jgi:hypothetical protein
MNEVLELYRRDPAAFARDFFSGFDPDPWQLEMLQALLEGKVIVCGRRGGKRLTLEAAKRMLDAKLDGRR